MHVHVVLLIPHWGLEQLDQCTMVFSIRHDSPRALHQTRTISAICLPNCAGAFGNSHGVAFCFGSDEHPDSALRYVAHGPEHQRNYPDSRQREHHVIRKIIFDIRPRVCLRATALCAGVAIPGNGTHNVLYVATEHDFLYAFDADNGAQLWLVNFLVNGATPLSPSDVGNTQDINPEIGITGTPTIDPTTNTLYVVVNTKESGNLIYRLHAIDITTGAEKLGGPVLITASVPGTAPDGNGSTVPLESRNGRINARAFSC